MWYYILKHSMCPGSIESTGFWNPTDLGLNPGLVSVSSFFKRGQRIPILQIYDNNQMQLKECIWKYLSKCLIFNNSFSCVNLNIKNLDCTESRNTLQKVFIKNYDFPPLSQWSWKKILWFKIVCVHLYSMSF